MKKITKLVFAIIICQAAGAVGSLFTTPAISSWYVFLNKPSFSPPNWLFGPVWVTLYTLMGVALYLIWQKGLDKKQVKIAFWFFIIHLIFNASWSVLFFGFLNPLAGLFLIIVIWGMILFLMLKFFKLDKRASWLLLPYLIWVSFATVLNFSIWLLN